MNKGDSKRPREGRQTGSVEVRQDFKEREGVLGRLSIDVDEEGHQFEFGF